MLIRSRKSMQRIEDITAYVKNDSGYELMSMKSLYKNIYNTMQNYINNADLNDNTSTYIYKNELGNVLSHFEFNTNDYNLIPITSPASSNILYNTKHWITDKRPFTCIPVWAKNLGRFGHRGFLITKKHVLYQYHSSWPLPESNAGILFLDENNQRVYRTVIDAYNIGGANGVYDSVLVRLDSDVPSTVKPAMFTGYPLHKFIADNTSNRKIFDNGSYNTTYYNYIDLKNRFYYPICTMHNRLRQCLCHSFNIEYNSFKIINTGNWVYNNGIYNFYYKSSEYSFPFNTYLNPTNSIFSNSPISGDSGHVKGFIYNNRYIIITKETNNSVMMEYEGDFTVGTSYIRYKDKIDEWEGVNADNYRPEYLTVYSV